MPSSHCWHILRRMTIVSQFDMNKLAIITTLRRRWSLLNDKPGWSKSRWWIMNVPLLLLELRQRLIGNIRRWRSELKNKHL